MGAEIPLGDGSAPVTLDEIRVFLGPISDEEYAVRHKLRTARNAASWRLTRVSSPHARSLLWMCSGAASQWVYEPAEVEWLGQIAEYCRSLLALADTAENLGAG